MQTLARHRLGPLALLVALAAFPGMLAACGGDESRAGASDSVLRFTAIPNENTTELAQKFEPVADYLARELGVEVRYVPSTDYGASVELFKNGDVHLAWFGGLTGVRARQAVPGARAIAQGEVDPEYKSYFVASGESDLERGDDFPLALEGRTFTFGSDGSTSGRLMPEHFIRQYTGRSPADFFGREMHFSGSHDKTAKLVEAGTFEAGVVDYKTYERMAAEGKLDPAKCRVIWETPPYADYNWTAHPALDGLFGEGFVQRLQAALVAMDEPGLLAAVNRPEGLIPAKNDDFATLEQVARDTGLVR